MYVIKIIEINNDTGERSVLYRKHFGDVDIYRITDYLEDQKILNRIIPKIINLPMRK